MNPEHINAVKQTNLEQEEIIETQTKQNLKLSRECNSLRQQNDMLLLVCFVVMVLLVYAKVWM